MLNAGVYLTPSPYKAGFISNADNERDIDLVLTATQCVVIKNMNL